MIQVCIVSENLHLDKQQYGDICTLYTACKHSGYIIISYYDIRAARKAMEYLQTRSMMGRELDIRYLIPKVRCLSIILIYVHVTFFLHYDRHDVIQLIDILLYQGKPSVRDFSQGMLVVSNVDHAISNDELHHIFGIYGDIKEVMLFLI